MCDRGDAGELNIGESDELAVLLLLLVADDERYFFSLLYSPLQM